MEKSPFFSIIVVSFNAEKYIGETINSILSQTFSDFEIIVKDGLSSDGTLAEIPEDDRIRVYSEKDSGIYDAMNRAVEYSEGKYLNFMNCGDSFAGNDVLAQAYDFILKTDNPDAVYYGDYQRKGIVAVQPSELTGFHIYKTPINHQSMFFPKNVFRRIGLYDDSMKICADYDLCVKSFKSGIPFVHFGCVVCNYMGDGISEQKRDVATEEYKRIVKRNFSRGERTRYELVLALSFRRLRQKISSDKSPEWLRKIYRRMVNKFNK